MKPGLNKVQIIGQVGRNPEMRYTPSGRPITTFSVGASRTWKKSDGEQHSETEWFNIVAWSNLAEVCKHCLTMDSLVYIEGRLQTRNWKDSEGSKRTSTEIVANEMIILNDHREDNNPGLEPNLEDDRVI